MQSEDSCACSYVASIAPEMRSISTTSGSAFASTSSAARTLISSALFRGPGRTTLLAILGFNSSTATTSRYSRQKKRGAAVPAKGAHRGRDSEFRFFHRKISGYWLGQAWKGNEANRHFLRDLKALTGRCYHALACVCSCPVSGGPYQLCSHPTSGSKRRR